uniref:Uncharacterized protein n=1 Tax=Anguilla anguilla TaxID=7936 RepID=A0A0E9XMG0_ANGAN
MHVCLCKTADFCFLMFVFFPASLLDGDFSLLLTRECEATFNYAAI